MRWYSVDIDKVLFSVFDIRYYPLKEYCDIDVETRPSVWFCRISLPRRCEWYAVTAINATEVVNIPFLLFDLIVAFEVAK